uniref:Uncharacterized protein n=1 Tax=Cucumis sativus TaxID=3659 RepID=A0A0A0LPL1_CUCSA
MASPCKNPSPSPSPSPSSSGSYSFIEDDQSEAVRRGPWSVDEDSLLIHSISVHGEGRWNLLAIRSGLRRTGKSYGAIGNFRYTIYIAITNHLKFSKRDQTTIYSNWSLILNISTNSPEFKDIINRFWIPRLLHQINDSSSSSSSPPPPPHTAATHPTPQFSDSDSLPAADGKRRHFEQNSTSSESVEISQVSDPFSDVPSWNYGGGETAAANFEYTIGDSLLQHTDWIDDDDSFNGCLWNFDGLWQF